MFVVFVLDELVSQAYWLTDWVRRFSMFAGTTKKKDENFVTLGLVALFL